MWKVHRKLAVHLEPDGIVLTPPSGARSLKVSFPTGRLSTIPANRKAEELTVHFESVAGILQGLHSAQLILVAKSVVVAHDQAREIRTVDSLVSIPLRRDLALARIHSIAQQQASTAPPPQEEEEHSEEDPVAEADELVVESQTQDVDSLKATLRATKRTKNFWRLSPFLPNSTTAPAILAQPCSPPSNSENQVPLLPPLSPIPTTPALPTSSETVVLRIALDEKVAKEVMRVMKGMYFSFEFDITNSLQRKHEKVLAEREKLRLAEEEKEAKLKGKLRKPKSGTTPSTETTKDTGGLVEPLESEPIYRRADERFWWNRHLVADFVNAEDCSDFLVVLQQGFITSVPFTLPTDSTSSLLPSSIPATPAQGKFIIISRRSIERPGLRYMRRGTNEKGGVANFVETEFIISVEREGELHIASFIQTRGSIPIFWSQSPWSIKPIPVLDRPAEENLAACKSHFDEQIKFYGRNVIVNLAEGGVSKEAIVVDAYRNTVEAMKEDKVKYVEFDFHRECRAMQYSKVSNLIDRIEPDLTALSCFWSTSKQVYSTQTGVVRTNCMDCLDRTNVVQSALARFVVGRHLTNLGLGETSPDMDFAFSAAFADNGDAISREYAGTGALKADFTRSGKRNWQGAVNDATNSFARLLHNTTSDFFQQAVIDYATGIDRNAISEFNEKLLASDPRESMRLSRIRATAIESSTAAVLLEGEKLVMGHTFLSPLEPGAIKVGVKGFEEKVVIISDRAVYVVAFEYTLMIVRNFVRIPTAEITSLQIGSYITSSLDAVARDPEVNYGFLLNFQSHAALERVHSYSMRFKPTDFTSTTTTTTALDSLALGSSIPEGEKRFFAFKALGRDFIRVSGEENHHEEEEGKSAKDMVELVTRRIKSEHSKLGGEEDDFILVKDIRSLEEAEAATALFDRGVNAIRRLIWA